MLTAYTLKVVTLADGRGIGEIVGVYKDGIYQGSYLEMWKRVRPGDRVRYGLNHNYLSVHQETERRS